MSDRLPWTYEVYQRLTDGRWCVFVRHDETPEWSRLVAEFPDQGRAESYCVVENDIADEGDPDHHHDVRPAARDSLPALPESAIKPQNFLVRTPTPAEKARVGAHLIGAAAAESGGGDQARVVFRDEEAPIAETLRRTLPTETRAERCAEVLKAIRDHLEEEDAFPSHNQMAARCDNVSVGSLTIYLTDLEEQGLIAKNAQGCRYLKERPDRPAKPKYGAQAAAVAAATNVRPEATSLAAAAKAIQARKTPEPRAPREGVSESNGRFNHHVQRRCQGCNGVFKTDSVGSVLCDVCQGRAARSA